MGYQTLRVSHQELKEVLIWTGFDNDRQNEEEVTNLRCSVFHHVCITYGIYRCYPLPSLYTQNANAAYPPPHPSQENYQPPPPNLIKRLETPLMVKLGYELEVHSVLGEHVN